MDQLPNWLTDAVHAAGMTAYAEGLDPLRSKGKVMASPSETKPQDEAIPPPYH